MIIIFFLRCSIFAIVINNYILNQFKLFKMKKIFSVVAALATCLLFFNSCSKQNLLSPAPVQQTVSSQQEDDAVERTTPVPGDYNVRLYIDDNDTSTRVFKNYVFSFKINGVLIATVNGKSYRGTWEMKDGGTEMKIDITGTAALDRIDKSWDVVSITRNLITLTDNDPGEITKIAFKRP
jgi:hypothetical protein